MANTWFKKIFGSGHMTYGGFLLLGEPYNYRKFGFVPDASCMLELRGSSGTEGLQF